MGRSSLPKAEHPNVEFLHTIAEVAEYFDVEEETVRRWINVYGVLKAVRIKAPKDVTLKREAWDSQSRLYVAHDSMLEWAKTRWDLK